MAWTKVYYDTKRQDEYESRLNDDGSTDERVTETWIAVSDSIATTTIEARSASDGIKTVPAVGAAYSIGGVAGYKCIRCLPKRSTESPNVFEIQVEFQRKTHNKPAGAQKWNVDVDISGKSFTQEAHKDKDGKPIENSAGKPFDPALPETFYDETIVIAYNTTDADSAQFATLRGKVNSGACSFNIEGMNRSFGKRELKCENVRMSSTFPLGDTSSTPVWKVTIEMGARKDGFIDKVLDQGLMYLGPDGVARNIKEGDTLDASQPVKLDGAGHVLAVGADPHFIPFKMEEEADLSPLFFGL